MAAAACIALAEGLDSVTLRRIAAELGVFPGLVSHYFPSVDDLVAAAFGRAATAEFDDIFAVVHAVTESLAQLRVLIGLLTNEERDSVSLLWLDAWQLGRRRPALHEEVTHQMLAWQQRITDLILGGIAAGQFHAHDPAAAAQRILAVVDGLSIQAAVRRSIDYSTVRDLAISTTEHELGLELGSLRPILSQTSRRGPVAPAVPVTA